MFSKTFLSFTRLSATLLKASLKLRSNRDELFDVLSESPALSQNKARALNCCILEPESLFSALSK